MVNKVKEYLKTQGINAYQTEDIPDVCLDEGIVFNDFDLFYNFIKNNNIKQVFVSGIYGDKSSYYISDELVNENIEDYSVEEIEKIKREVNKFNEYVNSLDFNESVEVSVVVLYEGKYIYWYYNKRCEYKDVVLLEKEDMLNYIIDEIVSY